MITLNFLVIVLCNEFVRGDKKKRFGSKSQIKMSSKTESSKLNLKFKSKFQKKREEKKIPICVISKSFLCRGKHTQILESVTTCQNLSKTFVSSA